MKSLPKTDQKGMWITVTLGQMQWPVVLQFLFEKAESLRAEGRDLGADVALDLWKEIRQQVMGQEEEK